MEKGGRTGGGQVFLHLQLDVNGPFKLFTCHDQIPGQRNSESLGMATEEELFYLTTALDFR